jgi:general secretion pathway protein J
MSDELNTTQIMRSATRKAAIITRNPELATRISQPASHNPQPVARIPQLASRNSHPAKIFFQSKIRNLKSKIGNPDSGFTLMEILLAFLILAIVMTTILGSFNAVFSTTNTLENSGKYYDMAKSCLNRMKVDLEALYVTQPPLYQKPEFDDPPDSYRFVGSVEDIGGTGFAILRFTSRAHISFDSADRGGIAEIVYYVQAKNDGQVVLKRSDHLYPYPEFEEKGSDPVLCRYVKSLAFKYFNADGEETETWNSDEEDYDHATPTVVGIVLEIGNESETVAFETMVKLPVHRKKLE